MHDRLSRAWLSITELAALVDADPRRAQRCLALWLSDAERETYAGFTVPKRRRDWLAGRVAAKEVARRRHGLDGDDALRRIEIVTLQDGPSKGKPHYRIGGSPGPFDLSISHSGDCAVAALAAAPDEQIGIDIEQIATRDDSFESLALSPDERATMTGLAGEARAAAITERWVLKEALSKALGTGLRLPFHHVTVDVATAHPRFRFAARELPGIPIAGHVQAEVCRVGTLLVGAVAIRPAA